MSGERRVYGPVASRRLGRSLGVDLVPFKTCSYDCVYCQLGRTTNKTTELRPYVPVQELLYELEACLRREGPAPEFITLAGSGEPTLHSGLGILIAGIKRMTSIPVAVLTNGSLLWMPEVREELAGADLVLPSLDAGSATAFARVNRPHPHVSFDRMVEGLIAFAAGFRGETWLEVFVLAQLTDRPEEILRIAALAADVRPARTQLNTVSRPAAERGASAVSYETLAGLCPLFAGRCEVIAEQPREPVLASVASPNAEREVLALLGRRPCTVEGIATGLGLAPNEVVKRLKALRRSGVVLAERAEGNVFYRAASSLRPGREQTA